MKRDAGRVRLWVHSYPGRGEGGEIRIKVGGEPFHSRRISDDDGWLRFDIPYRDQGVVVEHAPLGWNMEYMFFDYMIQPARR